LLKKQYKNICCQLIDHIFFYSGSVTENLIGQICIFHICLQVFSIMFCIVVMKMLYLKVPWKKKFLVMRMLRKHFHFIILQKLWKNYFWMFY